MPFTSSLPSFTANEVLPAADLQTLSDALASLSGAWTSYTPVWAASGTQPVVNNGTILGKYTQTGKRVDFVANLLIGSTTTVGSGTYTLTLPVAAKDASWCASAHFFDASAGGSRNPGVALATTGNLSQIVLYSNTGQLVGHGAERTGFRRPLRSLRHVRGGLTMSLESLMAELAGLVVVLGAVVAVTRKIVKRVSNFLDDWGGQEARPGVPAQPGVMQRIKNLDDGQLDIIERLSKVEREFVPDHGYSMHDKVTRIEQKLST